MGTKRSTARQIVNEVTLGKRTHRKTVSALITRQVNVAFRFENRRPRRPKKGENKTARIRPNEEAEPSTSAPAPMDIRNVGEVTPKMPEPRNNGAIPMISFVVLGIFFIIQTSC